MASIEINNSANSVVATIPDASSDTSSPITLIGRGFSSYAKPFAENMYHIMENFSNSSAPSSPVPGMDWFHPANGMSFYDGSNWISYATASNADTVLSRLSTADNIDFSSTGSHNIHTGATGKKTLVSGLIIVPNTGASVSGAPPQCQVEVASNTGDVADKIVLGNLTADTKYYRHNIAGANRIVAAGDTIKLNITKSVAGGSTLICDVYLMGIVL